MKIGHIDAMRYGTTTPLLSKDITNLTITSGKVFVQIDGGFLSGLGLTRMEPYTVTLSGLENQPDISMLAVFEDYTFNAGASDYTDGQGVHHSGEVVLSNQLQFGVISAS